MRNEEKKVRGIMLQMTFVLGASLVLALAAVAVPSFSERFGPDHLIRADHDVHAIAAGFARYMVDTGFQPSGFHGAPSYSILRGPGESPEFQEDPGGWIGAIDWFLTKNYMANFRWHGPYIEKLAPDPWGHRYIVFVAAFHPNEDAAAPRVAWVLSAGANGVIDTTPDARDVMGDDIGCPVN